MSKDSQSALRMTKGISCYCHFWIIIKLCLEEMKPQLEILDDIIVVSTSLILLNISSTKNFPIFSFKQLLNFLPIFMLLFFIPSLEEPHLTIHKHPMRTLTSIGHSLPLLFAFPKHIFSNWKYIFDCCEAILHEIWSNIALASFGFIVTFKIEDPEGIQMRMHCHVQGVWSLTLFVGRTVLVHWLWVAWIAIILAQCCRKQQNQKKSFHLIWWL